MPPEKTKILAIVGPTASGKTSLSIKLAKHFAGEVISADSRQVYKGLDLGTGKVTTEEMNGIPHHLLDIVEPSQVYTASHFVKDADEAVLDIKKRQKLPIIAGGTFFYLDMLLGTSTAPAVPPNTELRSELENQDTNELTAKLEILDPIRAKTIVQDNKRRLIRAIEIATALGHVPSVQPEARYDCFKIGIKIDRDRLVENIHTRLLARLEAGMVEEVEKLLKQGITYERLDDLGLEYRYLAKYLKGDLTYEQLVTELETKIRQFAKRQMTWLKRDTAIHWFDPQNKAEYAEVIKAIENWQRITNHK